MFFLKPSYLWFLFLVFIPIIIHLINLRRYKTVYFSNLRFLNQIEQQSRRKRKLVEYILLLLRVLAIIALVFAFARPIKKISSDSLPCQDNVVIYIDNSFSMELRGKNGISIELAKKKAYEIIKAYEQTAKFIVLTNDFLPEQYQAFSHSKAINFISQIEVSTQVRTLSQVFAKIKNIISQTQKCKHYVYVISDYQKATMQINKIVFPKNWQVYFLPINNSLSNNISIDSVFFSSPYHSLQTKDSLVVVLKNYGQQKRDGLRVELWINDSLKGFQNISLKAKSQLGASFSVINTKPGWNSGFIRISDETLSFDNKLFFSYLVYDKYKVLLVGSNIVPHLLDLYNYKFFTSKVIKNDELTPDIITKYNVIVLYKVKDLSSGIMSYLYDFVSSGGSLVILPDLDNFKSINLLLQLFNLPKFQVKDTQKTQLWNIDLYSNLYKGAILEYEKNELLPKIESLLLRKIDYTKERAVLIAKNGQALLSVSNIGLGKVYIFSFDIDLKSSDFVTSPLFVVSFVNIALQIKNQHKEYFVIGHDKWFRIRAKNIEYVKLKLNDYVFIPMIRYIGSDLLISLQNTDFKAGNYLVQNEKDSLISVLSLNYSRLESDLSCYTSEQINRILKQRKIENVIVLENVISNITPIISKDIEIQSFWKIFVILSILFLILEVLIKRIFN